MKKNLSYLDSVHRDGRIWNLSMAGVFFLFPVALCLFFQTLPEWDSLGKGLLATLPMYWAVGAIEVITYVPMLGAGSSYLSFVTGNISNLKLPCALNALESSGYKTGTEEGEIVSTISAAVSSIVTTIIILIGVILTTPLMPILKNPVVQVASDQLLPALFGALGVVFISKNWKIAVAPICLMLILFIFVPALNAGTVGIMVPVSAVFTIGVSFLMYKIGWIKDNKEEVSNNLSVLANEDGDAESELN